MMPTLTLELRKALRGYILRALFTASPGWIPESTLKLSLHTLQVLPPDEELLREINYLRDCGYLESRDIGKPGDSRFLHRITPEGHELVTGETVNEHVWVS